LGKRNSFAHSGQPNKDLGKKKRVGVRNELLIEVYVQKTKVGNRGGASEEKVTQNLAEECGRKTEKDHLLARRPLL